MKKFKKFHKEKQEISKKAIESWHYEKDKINEIIEYLEKIKKAKIVNNDF